MPPRLNIVVPVKRVIDYAIKPRVNAAKNIVETNGVKFSLNPFCEIAVEEAVRLRESNKDLVESITLVSAGSAKAQDALRSGLAMGADKAALIECPGIDDSKLLSLEPLAVAKLLKAYVDKSGANLVIMGKQAIDDDANQTGQMLAGLLNWSQATNASKVDVAEDGTVSVTREVDGGSETLAAKLPMVITTDLRLNVPRYTKLQDIMKAKKKKTDKLSPADLGVDITPRLETVSLADPPKRVGGAKVDSVDSLISKLKEVGAI
ncbi:hypothetical protein BZA70DRAFT_270662 [Myxozyma melibiosi]|uniref:Probable electron transfer flavoprotein subunit beta n=1 Tax=Myxozyma melibiosi TaxID=54550 RepID=A0ABR1FBE7_9ASCO